MRDFERDFQDVTLRDYLLLLRRNLRFLVSIILIVMFLGLIYILFQKPLYEAEAVVLPPTGETGIGALGSDFPVMREFSALKGEASPSQIVIALLSSRSLKEKVVKKFKLDSIYRVENMEDAIKELDKRMNTRLKRKTGVIEIDVLSRDPILAAQMANFIIDLAERMNEELQIFVDKPMLRIIDKAVPPTKKKKPDIKLNLLLSFIIGILIAFACLTLKSMRDNKIYSLWQVKDSLGTSRYILFPKVEKDKMPLETEVFKDTLFPLVGEYISNRKKKFILVTSPRDKEGKTFVAIQISRLFTSLHYSTLLVDLNIKNPRVQSLFGNGSEGVMEFLKGEVPLEEVITPRSEKTPFDTVALGNGNRPEFVLREEDISKLKKLTEMYDCVVVDTPGLLESAFAHPLLNEVEEVFLVLLLSKTTEEDIAKCNEILDALQVERLNVVLNGFDKKIHSMEI